MSGYHPVDQTTVSPDAKHQTVLLYGTAERGRVQAVFELNSMRSKSRTLSSYHAQWNSDDVCLLDQLFDALNTLIGALYGQQSRFELARLHHCCRQMINAYHACGLLLSNLLSTKASAIHDIINEMATALKDSEGPLYEWMSWLSSPPGGASNSLLEGTEDEASAHQSVEEAAYIPVLGQPYAIFLWQTHPHGIQPSSVVYSMGPSHTMFSHDPYSVVSGPGTGSLPFSAHPTHPPSYHSQLALNDPQLYGAAPPTTRNPSDNHRVRPSWPSLGQIPTFIPDGSRSALSHYQGKSGPPSSLNSTVEAPPFKPGAALHRTGSRPQKSEVPSSRSSTSATSPPQDSFDLEAFLSGNMSQVTVRSLVYYGQNADDDFDEIGSKQI
jgi:hypothetical protein